MPKLLIMPQLSDTMTEGVLVKWHIKEGDKVELDQPFADVETDKATMEAASRERGTVHKLLVAEGGKVPVKAPQPRNQLLRQAKVPLRQALDLMPPLRKRKVGVSPYSRPHPNVGRFQPQEAMVNGSKPPLSLERLRLKKESISAVCKVLALVGGLFVPMSKAPQQSVPQP